MTIGYRPARVDDAPPVAELFNFESLETSGVSEYTPEELENDWRLPEFALETDTSLAVSESDTIVGYGDIWGRSTDSSRLTSAVRVHPHHTGQGIGTALNLWVEERAGEILQGIPELSSLTLISSVSASNSQALEVLRHLGRKESRRTWEMAMSLAGDLASPVWPNGVILRPLGDLEIRDVYAAQEEAFRDHWGHLIADSFEKWKHMHFESPRFDPDLWFVACEGDEIAGLAFCTLGAGDDTSQSVVDVVGVRRPWRRRGLGVALLRQAFLVLNRKGAARVTLNVDSDSLTGATGLYEKVGMTIHSEQVTLSKEI